MLYKSTVEGAYKVTCAETYAEAVACLTATHPDLILLDMTMPLVNGLEFLDILRYTPSYAHIPVIIVSANSDPSGMESSHSAATALRRYPKNFTMKRREARYARFDTPPFFVYLLAHDYS